MIRVQINGDTYGLPESTDDITLEQHIKMLDVEKSAPKIWVEITNERNPEKRRLMASRFPKSKYIRLCIPYFCRVIEAQMGVSAALLLKSAPVHTIEKLFWQIQNAYVNFTDEKKTVFEIDGALWELPAANMEKSTFGEFAEAAQFEEFAADVASGQYAAMPSVMSVLLRPRGEKFDPDKFDEVLEERKAVMMRQPMTTVYQVAFFLTAQKQQSAIDSAIYTVSRAIAKSRQVQTN